MHRRHHLDVAHVGDGPLAAGGRERAVEDGEVLFLEVRRALDHLLLVDVADDLVDLSGRVAELAQYARHRLVDDLHHPAAHQLLVLDEGDVGLDAGGVAVHHEADRPGGREHGDLAVAVAVLRPQGVGLVPHRQRRAEQLLRHQGRVDHVRVLPVLVDHAQHGLGVLRVAGEGAHGARDPGALRVGLAVHEGGDGCREGPAGVGVVGQAPVHQEHAEVGIAEAERPVIVAVAVDGRRRVARVVDEDLLGRDERPARRRERLGVELPVLLAELHEVERREVARGVVEEHVLGAVVNEEAVR